MKVSVVITTYFRQRYGVEAVLPQRLMWWNSFAPRVVRRALMELDQVLDCRRPAPR
jgi:hypothetical protein